MPAVTGLADLHNTKNAVIALIAPTNSSDSLFVNLDKTANDIVFCFG